MTHVACESKLRSFVRSSMHLCPGNVVAIGRAFVYNARAAHIFSAGIKCRHCSRLFYQDSITWPVPCFGFTLMLFERDCAHFLIQVKMSLSFLRKCEWEQPNCSFQEHNMKKIYAIYMCMYVRTVATFNSCTKCLGIILTENNQIVHFKNIIWIRVILFICICMYVQCQYLISALNAWA